jgi:hypothetical protein
MIRRFAWAFLALLLLAGAPQAAISAPFQIGTGSSGSPVTVTTSAAAPVGTLIVVVVGHDFNTVTSVVDSASNSYSSASNVSGDRLSIFYCIVTTNLPSGGTITVTGSNSSPASVTALGVSGVVASSPLDAVGTTATGTSNAVTAVSTGTLAQASKIVIGAVGVYGATTGFSAGGSFTAIGGENANNTGAFAAYLIVSSTASVSWSANFTTVNGDGWGSNVVSFKLTTASPFFFLPTPIP